MLLSVLLMQLLLQLVSLFFKQFILMFDVVDQLFTSSNDIFTIVFFVLAVLFAFIWRDFLAVFVSKTHDIIFSNDLRTFYSQNAKSNSVLSIILAIISVSTISIYLYKILYNLFDYDVQYWHILLIIIVLHLYRVLSSKFIEWLFSLRNICSIWFDSYAWVHYIMGVVFFPLAIFITYRPIELSIFTIYIAVVIFIFSELLLIYRLFILFCKDLWSLFYLFLYLCTIEIMPLLVLYRLLK